jgi:hypothetical protein
MQIRKMLIDGEHNDTIIESLKLNRRTYFRLAKHAFDSDMKALEKQNTDTLMREMVLLLQRYNSIYRTLKEISEDSTISADDRLGALGSMAQNAKARVELFMMSPGLSIRQRRKLEALQKGSLYFDNIRARLPPIAEWALPPLPEQEQQQEEYDGGGGNNSNEEEQERRDW